MYPHFSDQITENTVTDKEPRDPNLKKRRLKKINENIFIKNNLKFITIVKNTKKNNLIEFSFMKIVKVSKFTKTFCVLAQHGIYSDQNFMFICVFF